MFHVKHNYHFYIKPFIFCGSLKIKNIIHLYKDKWKIGIIFLKSINIAPNK